MERHLRQCLPCRTESEQFAQVVGLPGRLTPRHVAALRLAD